MGKTDYKRLQKKLGGEVIKVHNENVILKMILAKVDPKVIEELNGQVDFELIKFRSTEGFKETWEKLVALLLEGEDN